MPKWREDYARPAPAPPIRPSCRSFPSHCRGRTSPVARRHRVVHASGFERSRKQRARMLLPLVASRSSSWNQQSAPGLKTAKNMSLKPARLCLNQSLGRHFEIYFCQPKCSIITFALCYDIDGSFKENQNIGAIKTLSAFRFFHQQRQLLEGKCCGIGVNGGY